ncbi:hypothetical protein CYR55_01235 [Chimaeribacter californicus]|uniref:DUF2591 domain-containing protein n=1 Tax=Chimaeribacter californicus TaxID=2060067 RepID=A0A2N5EG05_9GAMM|nr:phage protein NinX family protein [Chimaeribacter californicus]PLR41487.1 hypothetical protein CYR55_01235 [Chimaeribacter californicus]
MIDWSEEHDSDINRTIAELTGENPDKWYPYGGMKGKDYCNNPADAWPIICNYRINLRFPADNPGQQWIACITTPAGEWLAYNTCPLRAAMECFLLSQMPMLQGA